MGDGGTYLPVTSVRSSKCSFTSQSLFEKYLYGNDNFIHWNVIIKIILHSKEFFNFCLGFTNQLHYQTKIIFTIFAILKQNFDMISILIYLLAHFVCRSHELSVIIVSVVLIATVWLSLVTLV